MKKIYILDDELPILEPLSLWFQSQNYSVKTFTTSTDLLKSMCREKPALLLMDINLGGEDGRQLCMLVKVKYRNRLPIILFSASPDLGNNYHEYEADAFIEKPFKLQDLKKIVTSYIE